MFSTTCNTKPVRISVFHAVFLLLMVVWLATGPACSKKGKGNVENISGALSERMADSLKFDGGTHIESEAPEGNADPNEAPQIDKMKADNELTLGQTFSTKLKLAQSSRKKTVETKRILAKILEEPAFDVVAVLIKMDGMEGYIRVPVTLAFDDDGFWAELFGLLEADETLRGMQDYNIYFAFEDSEGNVGAFVPWQLDVADRDPILELGSELAQGVEGGKFTAGIKPASDFSDAAPQILDIEGPDSLSPGEGFTLNIYTDFVFSDMQANVIFGVPMLDGYVTIEADAFSHEDGSMVVVSSVLSPQFEANNLVAVLMIALQSGDGAPGEYRGWSVRIVSETPDCDDLNACTTDKLDGNTCTYTTKDCSDAYDCTRDLCNPLDGTCVNRIAVDACLIENTCYARNDHPEGNACLVCSPTLDAENWSFETLTTCDDGDLCTDNDRCNEGECEGEAITCNDHGVCLEASGDCECNEGYAGPNCGLCDLGYSGYPDCMPTQVCTPDDMRCLLTKVQRCNEQGTDWETEKECADEHLICRESEGEAYCDTVIPADGDEEVEVICDAGQSRCTGSTIEICSSDGSMWEMTYDCAEFSRPCVMINGSAVCEEPSETDGDEEESEVCTPNVTDCQDTKIVKCDSTGGAWIEIQDCADFGQLCEIREETAVCIDATIDGDDEIEFELELEEEEEAPSNSGLCQAPGDCPEQFCYLEWLVEGMGVCIAEPFLEGETYYENATYNAETFQMEGSYSPVLDDEEQPVPVNVEGVAPRPSDDLESGLSATAAARLFVIGNSSLCEGAFVEVYGQYDENGNENTTFATPLRNVIRVNSSVDENGSCSFLISELPLDRWLVFKVYNLDLTIRESYFFNTYLPSEQYSSAPSVPVFIGALAESAWSAIPTGAGLEGGIAEGRAMVLGEVMDCNRYAIRHATIGASVRSESFSYFNGDINNLLPLSDQEETNKDGRFTMIDLLPGSLDILALAQVNNMVRPVDLVPVVTMPDAASLVGVGWKSCMDPTECTPGVMRCADDVVELCNEMGYWDFEENCVDSDRICVQELDFAECIEIFPDEDYDIDPEFEIFEQENAEEEVDTSFARCGTDSWCPTGQSCDPNNWCVDDCTQLGCEYDTCNEATERCEYCDPLCSEGQCCVKGEEWLCGECCDPPCEQGQVCSDARYCVTLECPGCPDGFDCGPHTGYMCKDMDLCDPDPCEGVGECDPLTGTCDCYNEGATGDYCESCLDGYENPPECLRILQTGQCHDLFDCYDNTFCHYIFGPNKPGLCDDNCLLYGCPEGYLCEDDSASPNYKSCVYTEALTSCGNDDDCSEGEHCVIPPVLIEGECYPDCVYDSDCPGVLICGTDGHCGPEPDYECPTSCPQGMICDEDFGECFLNCPNCPLNSPCCDADSAPNCYTCDECVNPEYCGYGVGNCCPGSKCSVSGTQPGALGICKPDPCDPNPCEEDNRNICEALSDDLFQCLCNVGYVEFGEFCITDPCDPNPCDETYRSQCIVIGENLYQCHCDEGYIEFEDYCIDDPCDPNPCNEANRTWCEVQGEGEYQCHCDDGYIDVTGTCEEYFDPCNPNPCTDTYRSQCEVLDTNSYECSCDEGYIDVSGICEEYFDPCNPNPCTETYRTQCEIVNDVAFECSCDDGYIDVTGTCEEYFDPCNPNPCTEPNRSVCQIGEQEDYDCYCTEGYTGVDCLPIVCQIYDYRCSDDKIEYCPDRLNWTVVSDCAAEQKVCVDGSSMPYCETPVVDGDVEDDEAGEIDSEMPVDGDLEEEFEDDGEGCNENEYRCNGTRLEQCYSGEWMLYRDCAETQQDCYDPYVDEPYCVTVDGDLEEDGMIETETEITEDVEEDSATETEDEWETTESTETECISGDSYCDGDFVMSCVEGYWEVSEDCGMWGGTCEPGPPAACSSMGCTESETQCNGDVLEECIGGQWETSQDCTLIEAYCEPGPPAFCFPGSVSK